MDMPAMTRTFTLRVEGSRPLTVNALASMHRMKWAAHTQDVRVVWWATARSAKVPRLERARIIVTPLSKNQRWLTDPGAVAPEAKAAIDGLVDAKVLPGDTGEHVESITFMPPRVCGVDGLELVLEEAA